MSDKVAVNNENGQNGLLGNQAVWFLLAFVLALVIRLVLLNGMVYTQNELLLVNDALRVSQQVSTETSGVPVYTGLTAWLFFLFRPGDFFARLVPALVGASIVLIPWFWKEKIGQKSALILSFALAADPTFLLFSRSIHGGIFSIAGLLWTFTLFKKHKPVFAGIPFAFAFLSGASFWSFLLIFGLTILIVRFFRPDLVEELFTFNYPDTRKTLVGSITAFLVSIFLMLTSFLLNPSGLSGVGIGIVDFVTNFTRAYEKPVYHSIYLLIAHSYLPVLLFIIGYFRSRSTEQRDGFRLGACTILISLIIGILVSRESFEILLLPVLLCWIGGAIWLAHWEVKLTESWLVTVFLIGSVVAILTYLSINLGRLSQLTLGTPQFWNICLMIAAGIILLVSTWWLVKFGWTSSNGNQVFLLTILCFLAITSLSNSTIGLRSRQQVRSLEYLDDQLVLPNNDVQLVLNDFSLTGKTIQQFGNFSLVDLPEEFSWYFGSFGIDRNQPGTSMILTRTTALPDQSGDFRGMNVILSRSIAWEKDPLATYLRTSTWKNIVFEDQEGVLWVRTNLFTGAFQ